MGSSLSTKTQSRGRRTGGSYRPMAEINVTPMVDVMLVLLIIFMVSAPMLTAGVDVNLPTGKAKSIQQEDHKPIELTITKDEKIYLAETEIKSVGLVTILQSMTEGQNDRTIYIRGDDGVKYGAVARVFGQLQSAGFNKVALILQPEQ